jgi:hypothetical protein
MTNINEVNTGCDVEIRDYGKEEKDIIIRYKDVNIKIDNDYLRLYNYHFETNKIKLFSKYSIKIYRYHDEPTFDQHYSVDGYIIKKNKYYIKILYDELDIYECTDYNMKVSKPKDYIEDYIKNKKEEYQKKKNKKV